MWTLIIGDTEQANPSIEQIEAAIWEMNNQDKDWVCLTSGDDMSPRIIVTGGINNLVLVTYFDEVGDSIPLIDKSQPDQGTVISTGVEIRPYPARYAIQKETAVEVLTDFFRTQTFSDRWDWE